MDDMTAEVLDDDIRAFIEGDGAYPELADLPGRWDSLPPDARAPNHPNYSARVILIASYINFAHTKRWAWDGLNRLLVTLQERREPIPDDLQWWACTVVSRMWERTLNIPSKPRNPRFAAQDDRDFRIMRVVRVLREELDMSREAAIAKVAGALGAKESTIKTVVEKMESFAPFKRTIRRP